MNLDEVIDIIKNKLSEERYNHSYEVMQRCEGLAKIYGLNVLTAKLVGIAHDIAKEISDDEKFAYIKENNVEIDEIEKNATGLLHGKIGADMSKKQFGFTDEMARAVRIHTTGDVNMSLLDKILFVADSTSDDRNFGDVDYVINLGNTDINKAVLYILDYKINSNIAKNKEIHPNSIKAKEYLLSNFNNILA